MNSEPIRVFLLDDHEIVRRGLHDLLEAEGDIEIVGESGSAREATARIPALRPHVAVLDARLPDGSGIDVCRDVTS
jgi:DNA-binding NarL/FixJ family response regulator